MGWPEVANNTIQGILLVTLMLGGLWICFGRRSCLKN